ncbi:MAG: LytTR family DNA-binding domain-containing protein [Saprospiraceae bacterium]
MNCIIIDDEPHAIDVLKRYVDQTSFLHLKQSFRNPVKALGFLREEKVDLIFLDINMPSLSGIQFVKSLENKPIIIFTTAYSEYAVESYELNVADYLLKPIGFDRFIKAINKANDLLQLRKNQQYLNTEPLVHMEDMDRSVLLKSGAMTHKVRFRDILFIEKDENYLVFQTNESKIYVRANMTEIFDYVPDAQFCRIHKSFVVALDHVHAFEVHQLMVGKYKIPIGASYREALLEKIKA